MEGVVSQELFSIKTHNGFITVQSPSGEHRTFRIKTQPTNADFKPGARLIGLLKGSDNGSDYQTFGEVRSDGKIHLWSRWRTDWFMKVARILENPEWAITKGVSFNFDGRCRCCNRLLTTPESVANGIGPVCAGREF